MDKLTPSELEDGTVIYIEATENVDASNINTRRRIARGAVIFTQQIVNEKIHSKSM